VFPHWNWPGYEGKQIAVWVHSNLDEVELLLNGQSLGAKEMNKNGHLAWNVKYAPGVIEARGSKDGKQVMTARRETTGEPAALTITADRNQIAANGEDVAMFAVEVRDAQGRVVPITDNTVSFKVTGSGKLIGVGNGDPTNQESDKDTERKAFAGLCMAIVQARKQSGSITVEATSPGLTSAKATIAATETTLRPQVASWEPNVPAGTGLTGLWRPMADVNGSTEPMAIVFTLVQDGNTLTGSTEGLGRNWAGGSDLTTPITDGVVDGETLHFKVGDATFSGRLMVDVIELQQEGYGGRQPQRQEVQTVEPGPAIGPPPDGTDPSRSPFRRLGAAGPLYLHRVKR